MFGPQAQSVSSQAPPAPPAASPSCLPHPTAVVAEVPACLPFLVLFLHLHLIFTTQMADITSLCVKLPMTPHDSESFSPVHFHSIWHVASTSQTEIHIYRTVTKLLRGLGAPPWQVNIILISGFLAQRGLGRDCGLPCLRLFQPSTSMFSGMAELTFKAGLP